VGFPHKKLIDANSLSWMKSKLDQIFLPMDAMVMSSIPLCMRQMDDFLILEQCEEMHYFHCQLAYHMLVDTKFRREAWLDGRAGPPLERTH
jgi:hypothetical protein